MLSVEFSNLLMIAFKFGITPILSFSGFADRVAVAGLLSSSLV
ncbi:hypothetical protein [Bacillus cereus]|nr:hypothetical protein [Bacillus cereus]